LTLLARVRLAECRVGEWHLLAAHRCLRGERGVRERWLGELSLTRGCLAELCLRAEWWLLTRLRLAERVAELCLRAESVLRERCLLAGMWLAKGRGTELCAGAGLSVRAVVGRTGPRVLAELGLARGRGRILRL
jgi:hypothetical protein